MSGFSGGEQFDSFAETSSAGNQPDRSRSDNFLERSRGFKSTGTEGVDTRVPAERR
jgi:hypothetical protein